MKMLDRQTNKKQRDYEDTRQTNKQKLSNKILLISKRLHRLKICYTNKQTNKQKTKGCQTDKQTKGQQISNH
jgi:hypothetical protein